MYIVTMMTLRSSHTGITEGPVAHGYKDATDLGIRPAAGAELRR